ncbi:MAG: DNA-binding protein [Puniceicoccaceae bacterium]|nr:MAG: DNA-binding protein [Puniceicoccaceae bacterium]
MKPPPRASARSTPPLLQDDAAAPWKHLPAASPTSAAVLAETLGGGQAFRWTLRMDGAYWEGGYANHRFHLRADPEGRLLWRPANGSTPESDAEKSLHHYLGADQDWIDLADRLPWRSDPHLPRCLKAFPGLRILRQPFGETLLAFLCSPTKRIPQISLMLETLAERFGDPLPGGSHALPTWERLARTSLSDLRACGLGFRARHIEAAARFLAARPDWLATTPALPYPEARARLLEVPGVGGKVADCILLFGAGRLEAFPIDTWIQKVLDRHYHLAGWSTPAVIHFARIHFGPTAGLAQQFLFAWERRHGSSPPTESPPQP